MRVPLLIAAACLAAAPASAADRLCAGKAAADGQEVSVVLRFDGEGQPVLRRAFWRPASTGTPADGAGPPSLLIGYDLAGDALGAPSSVGVAAWAKLDPQPKSTSAWVQVTLDDGRTWAVQWGMFADSVARLGEIRKTYDGYSVGGFAGNVVVGVLPAKDQRGRNVALVAAAPAARSATVTIAGSVGDEDLGRARVDLSRIAVRDALFARAYADARDPARCTGGGSF
jgi:hypothetical protein